MGSVLKALINKLQRNLVARRQLMKVSALIRKFPAVKSILAKYFGGTDVWSSYKDLDEFAELRLQYPTDYSQMLRKNFSGTIGFVAASDDELIRYFTASCDELGVKWKIFDFKDVELFSKIKQSACTVLLLRPSFKTAFERQAFFEKAWTFSNELDCAIYPSLRELSFYEAKRQLAYFLEAKDIPHPVTKVFLNKEQAAAYIHQCEYPQVFKAHNGASSSSVEIVYHQRQAEQFVSCLFDSYYVNKQLFDARDIDYGYLLLQQYISNVREFRILKIGDSWFGHEKDKHDDQEFMSGSGTMKWTAPPHRVLDFCLEIAENFAFTTMCFDVFLDLDTDTFYINELQTWFGSYNPSQMYVDGIPGRYYYRDAQWHFEMGLFNEQQSMKLRIVDIINIYGT